MAPRESSFWRLVRRAALAAGVVFVVRREAPRMIRGCMDRCRTMMEGGGGPFAGIVAALDRVEATNRRIIELLEALDTDQPGDGEALPD